MTNVKTKKDERVKRRKEIARKIQYQLIVSCLHHQPYRRDEEYIYFDEILRRAFSFLFFWRKKSRLNLKDRLKSGLLK